MSTGNPRVLVLGGSGFVGRSVCEQLVREFGGAARITVPTRRLRAAQAVQSLPGLTVLQADLFDEAQLRALLAQQDAVINLVAILQGSEAAFQHVHVELPQRLAAACRASGVRRLIHVSALGVSDQAPSRYLRSKAHGEAALQTAAQMQGLDLTLLRPSVIFGQGDRFLNLFARLQTLFPLLPLAGAKARFQPVWVEDVAAAIVRCVVDADTVGQTYELAGPQVASLADLVRLAGRCVGRARPILPLPGPLAWLQAVAMELLPGVPLMSRDNLASMQVPNVAGGELPGLAALGIQAHAASAIVPAYLGSGLGLARLDRWRAGAGR
ncbi:complex I NDUFA9 subunit family protein [Paucibacter sp. O1-1]|nr:complex I NDUFA9 subunit family protein [Paucibacter sp. O1-1]MDA3828839.1 complex I NDUFA9 subunit family protein [Paucibacter sp. O1-1]